MVRGVAMLCAGGLLIILASCSFRLGNNVVQVGVKVNEEVVKDSIENVSQRLQGEMTRLGLQVAATPEGDAIRLTSATKSGQKFMILLSRTSTGQTTVHVDWEQASDRELWLQLLFVAGQATVSARQ